MIRILGAWTIHFRLLAAGISLSGIYRCAPLALPAILAAVVGCVSPVFATTTISSNWIQNLSLDADPQRLSNHETPKIAVSGSYVHAVWKARKLDGSGKSLYYRRSADGGKTFEAPKLLAQDSPSDFFGLEFDSRFNNLVADGAYVHIFYTVGWPQKLNYLRSADNGATFAPTVTFSSGYYSYAVYATAANGNVAVGWTLNGNDSPHPRSLYNSRSSDGGATFSTTTVVLNDDSHNPGIFDHSIVDAMRSGSNVYFLTVIQDQNDSGSQSHLLLWASTDGGATFKAPQKVNVKASNNNFYARRIQDADYSPNLAASGNEVNVVWINDDNPGGFDGWHQYSLRTRRSTDAGTTLGDPVTLHTYPAGYASGAYVGLETIARIGNRVHVLTVKGDDPVGSFIWTSNDGGASWGAEKRISTGGWWPQIQLDGTRVHVANSSYFRSADAGVTFDGGINPHDSFGSWNSPRMVLGTDGAAHYIGSSGTGSSNYDSQIMYRRIAPEPAPGTTDKVVHMTRVDSSRVENLQIAATPDINFSSAMTVETWVRLISGDRSFLDTLIAKSRVYGDGSYVLGTWSDYQIYTRIVTTQTDSLHGAWLGAGVALPLGTWTHIAMTYDANGGADNLKLYVNGNLASKATIQGTIVTDTLDSPLRIGDGSAGYPGQVEIDELRLWNRARTQAEIQADMTRQLAGTESGLTAYYNFNDTFKDITGRGNDAVPMYFESFAASTRSSTTQGNYGRNLVVNGDAEAVPAASSPVASFPGWTTDGNVSILVYGSGGFPSATDPGPATRSNNFFYGGSASVATASQNIDLSFAAADIDAGKVKFDLSAWLGGYSSQDDATVVSIGFFGAASQSLGSSSIGPVLSVDRAGATGLLLRTVSAPVPANARRATVTLQMTRASGSDNDGSADNVSVVLTLVSAGGSTTTTTTVASTTTTTLIGASTTTTSTTSSTTLVVTTTTTGATTTTTKSTTTTTLSGGGAATLNLVVGWNLLGNSSSTSLNVASAFGDGSKVTTVWKWVASKANWAFYTPTIADGGAAYAASKGYDFMNSVAGGEGFWVNANTAFSASLPAGTAINSASFQGMASGWNLIAIGDNKTPRAFNNAIGLTPPSAGELPINLTTLWAWDATLANWYFYAPSLDKSGGLTSYIQSKSYLDFGTNVLTPTTGFWVNNP